MTLRDNVWKMLFDSAPRIGPKGKIVVKAGVVFVSPSDYVLPRAFSLTDPCSNNVVEYNVLLIGLQLARQMDITYLKAYGHSKLIFN